MTILIPTYKRPHLLKNAVISAMKQRSEIPYEIIVVDNNQSAEVLILLSSLHLKFPKTNLKLYQHSQNIGLYGNWNSCLQLGNSDWISILSDDDVLHSNWLEEMWKFKIKTKNALVLGCGVKLITKDNKELKNENLLLRWYNRLYSQKTAIRKLSALDYFIGMPHLGCLGLLINRQAAQQANGFISSFHPCSDFKMLADIVSNERTYITNKVLATYQTEGNTSSNPEIAYLGLSMNRKIQMGLIDKIPLRKKSILTAYIGFFCAKSVLGMRRHLQNYPPITKYIKDNKVPIKFTSLRYFFLKLLLLFISKKICNRSH